MEENRLSKRLRIVADLVAPEARLADIGSDHAYLPATLIEEGKISFAVAGEVVEGPFKNAEKAVRSRGLSDRLSVRLGDGCEVITDEDQIDTVTICGMGGVLIRDILKKGRELQRINGNEHLILQPNVGEKALREWLMQAHYEIVDEEIVIENEKIYEILSAKPVDNLIEYSEQELVFGPKLLEKKSEVFRIKWKNELEKVRRIKQQIEQSSQDQTTKINELDKKIKQIEDVIS